ncbi:MAG: ATP-grasp domain-containing protein [Prevotella sp.]|nr:ATP-grasp domain-containing protein [Prevotella sp.]
MGKKRNIVVVEPASTGFNLIDDVKARGYQPVAVIAPSLGTDEDREVNREFVEKFLVRLPKEVPVIGENPNYEEVLEEVRKYDPLLVIPGSDFGVELATRLGSDLGLRGNKWANIGKMTRKSEMHQALADHGIRYIRGRIVNSEEDARAFYEELGTTHIVVKPTRGAATQGVLFCEGLEETLSAVRRMLALAKDNEYLGDILVQERVIGKEYIVNTVSSEGRHRLVSMWQYNKIVMNGSNLYENTETINHLDVGHSQLIRYAYQVLDAVGIEWGAVHGEYIIDERGPVLIEVNCRTMGLNMSRYFIEQIFGHHETDAQLDAYLYPEKFEQEAKKPYRPKRKAMVKSLIVAKDVNLQSAPILQLVRHLKSFFDASLERMAGDPAIARTHDLETSAGNIYLVSEDERQVKADCLFLHRLESNYPQMLLNELKGSEDSLVERQPLDEQLSRIDPCYSTLVFSDSDEVSDCATVVDGSQLTTVYDSYEQGLLDISRQESFSDVESLLQQIFVFFDKLREGARIYIPESTYCHLPYGIEGMEIILYAAGLTIEAPRPGDSNMVVVSK